MGNITKKDLALLLEIDENMPDDAALRNRKEELQHLLKAGLIDGDVNLTVEGAETIENLHELLQKLRAGIPVSSRKSARPDAAYADRLDHPWKTGTIGKKPIVTDNRMLYVGKPVNGMQADRGSPELRQKLPGFVAKQKGIYVDVVPTYYQTDGNLPGIELVWLENEKKKVRVAIQAMYFDFVMDKFPSAKWLAANGKVAVKASIKGKGITKDSIVALVMPYLTKGWKKPGSKHGEKMPE